MPPPPPYKISFFHFPFHILLHILLAKSILWGFFFNRPRIRPHFVEKKFLERKLKFVSLFYFWKNDLRRINDNASWGKEVACESISSLVALLLISIIYTTRRGVLMKPISMGKSAKRIFFTRLNEEQRNKILWLCKFLFYVTQPFSLPFFPTPAWLSYNAYLCGMYNHIHDCVYDEYVIKFP